MLVSLRRIYTLLYIPSKGMGYCLLYCVGSLRPLFSNIQRFPCLLHFNNPSFREPGNNNVPMRLFAGMPMNSALSVCPSENSGTWYSCPCALWARFSKTGRTRRSVKKRGTLAFSSNLCNLYSYERKQDKPIVL